MKALVKAFTKARIFLPIMLVLAMAASGCVAPTGGTGGTGTGGTGTSDTGGTGGTGTGDVFAGNGRLVLQITDQPLQNAEKAEVTISLVMVHTAGAGNESGWVPVMTLPKTFDLVAIKDVSEYLGEKSLDAGKYNQIRLDVSGASATISGVAYNLTIPSRTIKLVDSFEIHGNETTTLTLDFDAASSIHQEGAGKYSMKPTIKVLASAPEVKEDEKGCAESGGNVSAAWCCKSSGNFPNLCAIGACGCSPENSHEIRFCSCGENKCFNGKKCVEIVRK